MVISDLNYMEAVAQQPAIQGAGEADADAFAFAEAFGQDISDAFTFAAAFASSFPGFKESSATSSAGAFAV